MSKTLDPKIDWLADASLTPEQRQAWNIMRSELSSARLLIEDMEKRISSLEKNSQSEETASILTRPEFNREVARMLAFDERYGGVSSVLYFDFENLEDVTARFGKAVTNAAIREISSALMRNIRNSDIIGRLAADEFGVLLARCENAMAWKKGEGLAAILRKTIDEIHGNKLGLTFSYGAYTFRDNEDVTTGLKHAAQSLTKGTP